MFTALPFSEDIRQFGFASFDANKKWIPSGQWENLHCFPFLASFTLFVGMIWKTFNPFALEEQQDAVDSLITSMDLTNAQRYDNYL